MVNQAIIIIVAYRPRRRRRRRRRKIPGIGRYPMGLTKTAVFSWNFVEGSCLTDLGWMNIV